MHWYNLLAFDEKFIVMKQFHVELCLNPTCVLSVEELLIS